jgi:alcohol dehydrogenase class IV
MGAGVLGDLGAHLAPLGAKPLIVTGRHSARIAGTLGTALAMLPQAVVYDQVDENPTTTACEAGAAFCKAHGCDCLVALGGGSPMDAAKAIALLATNPGNCSRYFGRSQFDVPPLPILAVPTTAGTGSEVTPYAVLVDEASGHKLTLRGASLFPRVALLDPVLSVTMPRHVTINTGLDALSQAMEGMLSLKSTALGDILALEICRLVKRWLPRAADYPDDLEARAQMLQAAMLSGCVIAQSGTTLVHGAGYYLTLEFGIAHGLANALLLSPIFYHNAQHEPQKVAALANVLGRPAGDDPSEAGAGIVNALHELFEDLNLSPAARDAGAREERLQWCAEDLHGDPSRFKNQVGEFTVEDVSRIYDDAFHGTVSMG